MDDKIMSDAQKDLEVRQDSIGWVDYAKIMARWRKFIFISVGVVTLIAGVISFVLPKWYTGTASVLPPKEESLLGGLGGVTSLLRDLAPVKGLSSLGRTTRIVELPGDSQQPQGEGFCHCEIQPDASV